MALRSCLWTWFVLISANLRYNYYYGTYDFEVGITEPIGSDDVQRIKNGFDELNKWLRLNLELSIRSVTLIPVNGIRVAQRKCVLYLETFVSVFISRRSCKCFCLMSQNIQEVTFVIVLSRNSNFLHAIQPHQYKSPKTMRTKCQQFVDYLV